MYIAIEGIKGSGKSTVLNNLLPLAKIQVPGLGYFPMTGPISTVHPMEVLADLPENLKNDQFIENLYRERAYWNQSRLPEESSLIIGDRSLATACVTRWNKWQDPYFTIKKTKKDYEGIIPVDIMIWMKTSVSTAMNNIQKRSPRLIGKNDEQAESLKEAEAVYHELFRGNIYKKKIKPIQLIEIENQYSLNEIQSEILNIINYYSKS